MGAGQPTKPPPSNLENEHSSITDESSANWIVRRILEARAYAQHVETWAAIEIQRAKSDERHFMHSFGCQLEDWLRQAISDQHLRRKSIALPAGKVGLRKTPSRLELVDLASVAYWVENNAPNAIRITISVTGNDALALRQWCKDHTPSAVLTETVSKTELNKHLQTSGELPDGAVSTGGTEQLYIASRRQSHVVGIEMRSGGFDSKQDRVNRRSVWAGHDFRLGKMAVPC
jgi:hypothetical protein